MGICKFGVMCKYYYLREKVGFIGCVYLNVLGFLLRLVGRVELDDELLLLGGFVV